MESFTTVPEVSAYYGTNTNDNWVRHDVSIKAELQNGKIALTCAVPKPPAGVENVISIQVTLTSGAKSQDFYIHLEYAQNGVNQEPGPGEEDVPRYPSTDNWAEAVSYINAGAKRVNYYGGDVTLTETLSLAADQHLGISDGSLTIGNGGVLILSRDNYNAASIWASGKITVASGGVIRSTSTVQSTRYAYAAIDTGNNGITVQNGGSIETSSYGVLHLYSSLTVQQGGSISVGESGYVYTSSGNALTVSGTVNISKDGFFHVSNTTVTETGRITSTGESYVSFSDGLVNRGTIAVNQLNIYGPMENYGTINISQYGNIENVGYSVYNYGTIGIASNVYVYLRGTVLMNTGTVSGSGTLVLNERFTSATYSNGIEYESVRWEKCTPEHYDYRRGFVTEPEDTAEITYFIPEFIDRGTSTVMVRQW